MSQRPAASVEQRLGLRPTQAWLQRGGLRLLVQLEQLVQAGEVERDDGREAPAQRLDSPDDAGPAAERDDGHARLRAAGEHGGHACGVRRQHDGIGSQLGVTCPAADEVEIALAADMLDAGQGIVAHLGDGDEPLAQAGRQRRRGEAQLLERHRQAQDDVARQPDLPVQEAPGAAAGRSEAGALRRITPAVPAADRRRSRCCGHLAAPPRCSSGCSLPAVQFGQSGDTV